MTALGNILSTQDIDVKAANSPTPGANVSLVVSNDLSRQVFSWTAGQNETVAISGSHPAGKEIVCIITNDGTLPRVITFGAGFTGLGIVTGLTSKISVVGFISNGTNFLEKYRSVGM